MKGKFVNKPLFKLQRKSNSKLFIIFSIVVSILLVITVAIFPTIQQVADQIPESFREMFTINSITEYFNAEALEMWILPVSLFVAVVAINITTNEFKNGSYELIYSLNISRGEIIRTKLLRIILNTIYINLISFALSLASLLIFGIGGFSILNLLIYTLFAILVTMQIAIIVFSLGLFAKRHFSTFAGVLTVIVMYLFTMLSSATTDGKFDWLGYLSPMSTMKGSILLNGFGGVFTNGILFGIWSLISLFLLFASCKKFKNDDLC